MGWAEPGCDGYAGVAAETPGSPIIPLTPKPCMVPGCCNTGPKKKGDVFKDDKYLKDAVDCGEVIWQRGLLRKGYGICHGTAGNGYAFLSLYRLTQDKKYLYRACKFAEWCLGYGTHGCRIPDRPYSLFEGMAGAIHYLSEIATPGDSCFPAFEL
ncbi:hypothetical protein CRUP_030085 [Coryphaenoides rupestris]|nr:hypothetical protein CRUP_030085 [Coryphaenoides rupestris]